MIERRAGSHHTSNFVSNLTDIRDYMFQRISWLILIGHIWKRGGELMKKISAIIVSSLFLLTGCSSQMEFGQVSSAIRDSQDMQSDEGVETGSENALDVDWAENRLRPDFISEPDWEAVWEFLTPAIDTSTGELFYYRPEAMSQGGEVSVYFTLNLEPTKHRSGINVVSMGDSPKGLRGMQIGNSSFDFEPSNCIFYEDGDESSIEICRYGLTQTDDAELIDLAATGDIPWVVFTDSGDFSSSLSWEELDSMLMVLSANLGLSLGYDFPLERLCEQLGSGSCESYEFEFEFDLGGTSSPSLCDPWDQEIFASTAPNFEILTPRSDERAADIEKVVEVFGVRLMALEGVTDRDLLLSANVLAQWIDNDEDGVPDNKMVQSELQRQKSRMVLGVVFEESIGPWHMEKQRYLEDENAPIFGLDVTTINHSRFGLEPSSYSDDWQRYDPVRAPDAATEETLHLVTHVGFAGVYPADFWHALPGVPEFASQTYRCYVEEKERFGPEGASRLTMAMDKARGGFFADIPDQYPDGAWYTRYDECDYACFVDEYVHWAAITNAGLMEGRVIGTPRTRESDGDEWSIETQEQLRELDPQIYELLNDPEFNFPKVAPDGTYRN